MHLKKFDQRRVPRRTFLKLTAAASAASVLPMPKFAFGATTHKPQMAAFPEKASMILLTDRPPQLETPIKYFKEDFTRNDVFFVRWHLAGLATSVDTATFRLKIAGHVNNELELSLDDLKKMEAVTVAAVCQCSGNSRSLYEPRVAGGQWGHGAVGNAKWTGVRLKDILEKAGVKDGAVDVSFGGLDYPPVASTPKFAKSLEIKKALDPDVIVAYQMNGADLPILNGFPIRLVVPGWYATYWVKQLNNITVLNEKFHSFWMDKAYRIPNNPRAMEAPDKLATDTVPISTMSIRSLIVAPLENQELDAGDEIIIDGVAFDSGKGITKVEVSTDGGKSWEEAQLGPDLGKFSFRRWKLQWKPTTKGTARIMAKATNAAGDTQHDYQWNRSGYQRDVIEHVDVTIA